MLLGQDFEDNSKHKIYFTAAPTASDWQEIHLIRQMSAKYSLLGSQSSRQSIEDIPNPIHWLQKFSIRKFMSLVPKGSKARVRVLRVFNRLPEAARISILNLVINRGTTSGQQDFQDLYSIDIGFGLPTSTSPRVSIVIPVHNQWFTTLKCLKALERNLDQVNYEIILVDDASTDITVDAAKNIRGMKIVRLENNIGYLRATNLGASFATGEYIVLLNNDTEPITGWIDSLVSELDQDISVAICGSTLLYPTGLLQEAGGQIFNGGNAWNLGRNQNPLQGTFRSRREVDYCSAAALIVRKSFWNLVGGFDERYVPAYCEDSDLCLQAWRLGYRVIFSPNSWVVHHEGVSHGTSTSSGLKRFQELNLEKLKEKWQVELTSHWIDTGVPRLELRRNSRGIVFVADRQLPAAIRDAGSIRTIQILKHLLNLNFHVVFTALDTSTTEPEIENLRQMGVEVHIKWRDALDSLENRKSRLKATWLIRTEVISFLEDKLREINPDIFRIADLLDLKYSTDSKVYKVDGNQLAIAQRADRTILVSEVEASILRSHLNSDHIAVVWAEYNPHEIDNNFASSSGCVFVGGFRHYPNEEGVLWFARQVLPHLRKLDFNSPIRIVGSGLSQSTSEELLMAGLEVMGPQDDLSSIYRRSRIAIVPLLSGRGRKGKLGEALSVGIPVVTTSIGAEGFNFAKDAGVAIADDPHKFASEIMRINSDETLWQEMSSFGKSYCEANLSSVSLAKSVGNILRGIDGR